MVYFLLILLILLLRQSTLNVTSVEKRNSLEIRNSYFAWGVLIFMAAFRHESVGTDTQSYIMDYKALANYDYFGLYERYRDYIGYYGLSKVFSLIGLPYNAWFGFVALVYAYTMEKFINKYSNDKLFSIIVFVTCGLYTFSLAGLKQVMGMSFIMLAYLQFINMKYLFTVVWLVMAYICHPASLIFLAAFPFYLIRDKKYFNYLIVMSVAFIFFASDFFLTTMIDVLDNEHFYDYLTEEGRYSYVTFIFYSVMVGLSLFGYKEYKKNCPVEAKLIFGFSTMGCGLQLLAGVSPSLFRLSFLYIPFMMILLPNTIAYLKGKDKLLLTFVVMGCLIFYFLYTCRNAPYAFMWQSV